MFIVTEKAQRPAGMNGTCFYCKEKVGTYHKYDCVLISKKVLVRMTAVYEITVPASWDSSDIEFHRNDGSWCADSAIEELEYISKNKGCLCNTVKFEALTDSGVIFLEEE